jgi:nitrogen fixation protein NifU and related proteins
MSAAGVTPHDDLQELFRATILDHSRHPRNRGATLTAPDIEAHGVNTSCGDRVALRLCVDDAGMVTAIEWEGQGCAISQASISMMTRATAGKSLVEVERIIESFRNFLADDAPPGEVHLGELEALAGVRHFPIRARCALLGWHALETGIAEYRVRRAAED